MRSAHAALVPLALACAAGSAGCGAEKPEITVAAAASLQRPLTACAGQFRGARVRLSFGGSDELAARVRQGVKPDLYLAANARIPAALAREGLLGPPVAFASGKLVLAVPHRSRIRRIGDLARPGTRLVVGSPTVPIGAYTRELLSRLPRARRRAIAARVRSEEPDVKGIVGKLSRGAADAGFVYESDVLASNGRLRRVRLPAGLAPRVTYSAGVVNGAAETGRARRFIASLLGGGCARALRAAGFGRVGR